MGLGTWPIGGEMWRDGKPVGYAGVDEREAEQAVLTALEAGVTFFDTSDAYGAGHAERLLGRVLGARRADVVIATKWGNTYDEERREVTGADASPRYVRTAVEASLRRLGADWIDVLQLHLADLPIEDALPLREVLDDLVREGTIRAYGWEIGRAQV